MTEWSVSLLTQEVELLGEDAEEEAAVHGEEDGEVGAQRAPHKEVIDGRPVARVQCNLCHAHTNT